MRYPADSDIFRDFQLPARFLSAQNSMDFIKAEGIKSISTTDPGVTSRQQATNWANVCRMGMAVETMFAGIRPDWENEYSQIFNSFSFSSTTNVSTLEGQALNALIGVGLNFLSAFPVLGNCLGAAVGIGKMIANLRNMDADSGRVQRFQRLLTYSRDTDEDMVENYVRPLLESWDWSPLFLPSTQGEWLLIQAVDDKGEEIEGVRVWRRANHVGHSTGFMPGTQRQTEFIQVGPGEAGKDKISYHEISDTGTFYPSTSQFCTFAWEAVNRMGNPDMFKVETDAVDEAWHEYFDSARHAAIEQFGISDRFLWLSAGMCPLTAWKSGGGTIIGKEIPVDNKWPGCYWGPNTWGSNVVPKFGGTAEPIAQMSIYHAVIKGALDRLHARQVAALEQTIASAYVRYESRNVQTIDGQRRLPAHAAFRGDSARAQQLRDLCRFVRGRMLQHDIRFTVNVRAVERVDPGFAADLRASGVPEVPGVGGLAVRDPGPLAGAGEAPPDSDGPQGGAPFDPSTLVAAKSKKKGGGGGIIVIGAAGLLLAGLAR